MSSPCLGDYFTKLSWRNSVMWLIGPDKKGGWGNPGFNAVVPGTCTVGQIL